MNSLLLYLVKVSAGTTILYLTYLLFFRRDTFYLRNRIFLILTLLIPPILPFLRIRIISDSMPAEPAGILNNIIYSEPSTQTTIASTIHSDSFDYYSLLGWIYFTVAILIIIRAVISLLSTYSIIKKGTLKKSHFPKVIISYDRLPPFSFFPFVVVPG